MKFFKNAIITMYDRDGYGTPIKVNSAKRISETEIEAVLMDGKTDIFRNDDSFIYSFAENITPVSDFIVSLFNQGYRTDSDEFNDIIEDAAINEEDCRRQFMEMYAIEHYEEAGELR